MKVLKEFIKMCYAKLYGYPRTLQGDKTSLKDTKLSNNAHNAITAVIEQKQALMALIEASEEIIDLLMAKKEHTVRNIQENYNDTDIEEYLKKSLLPMIDREIRAGVTI